MPPKKTKLGTCPECGCSVKPENLERHLHRVHGQAQGSVKTETEDYSECPECGTRLKSWNLDRHLRKIHGLGTEGFSDGKGDGLSPAQKRLIMKENRRKRQFKFLGIVAIIILVPVIVWFVYRNVDSDIDTPYTKVTTVEIEENRNYVVVPTSELSDGKLHKYSYLTANGTNVRYFLVQGSDKAYHAAIDLCVKRHPGNTGWIHEGDYIICETEKCMYPVNAINSGDPGCCMPINLQFEEVGGKIRVERKELESAAKDFEQDVQYK